jgi:hypothetical protein
MFDLCEESDAEENCCKSLDGPRVRFVVGAVLLTASAYERASRLGGQSRGLDVVGF